MVKRSTLIAAFALCLTLLGMGLLAGCSGQNATTASSSAEAQTITDMLGRNVTIPKTVDRVIGIGCALRPICYVDAVDKVVGVEQSEQTDSVTCAYRHVYHDLFASLPVIGDGGSKGVTPNEEAIIQAAPQVIICDSLAADEADALQQKTGIPVVCLNQPETFLDQDYYDNLAFLGEVLGKQQRAQEVIDYLKAAADDLKTRASASSSASATAYAAGISYRGGHGFDGTEANFAPFSACGITNVADSFGTSGPFTIDLEAVSKAQPDYIFIESSNLSLVADDYHANSAYFNALNAVQKGQVNTLISYRFYSTNVELALANCYQVGSVVCADTFADVNPTEKLDAITQFFLGTSLSSDLAAAGYQFQQIDLAQL